MSDTLHRAYRDVLQRAQKKAGKNNSMITRETGLSRPSVIAVMHGRTSNLDLIEPVARALGVPMNELFEKAA
jgi:hypothetical protein